MTQNSNRCEVPFPDIGEGHYIRFTLGDLTELEAQFGESFFDSIESACARISPKTIITCLKIGLKKKSTMGDEKYAWDDIDQDELQENDFVLGSAGEPILEAITLSWLGKTYDQLIKDAEKARKERAEQQKAELKSAVSVAAEVAKDAGVPFDQEASLGVLLKMLTEQGSTPLQSGG